MAQDLRVSEIFYSLQGEARNIGIPTVFVRLTGCPLRCHYCDTSYAFTGGTSMELREIQDRVEGYGCSYVTVTGGEPLAQKGCVDLLQVLVERAYQVSLETSGALDISVVPSAVSRVVDIKTPGSGEEMKNRWENTAFLTANDQVKFVICDRRDYDWVKQQIYARNLAERCEVLVSPAVGTQNPTELAEWVLADGLPVRFQLQLHKLLWGDQPGK